MSEHEMREDLGEEKAAVTRRALLKAGWAIPVVLATASLPTRAFAQDSVVLCPGECDPNDPDNCEPPFPPPPGEDCPPGGPVF